ncbi:MAG: immunoglobulin-like domain-containing protein [Clostridium sp.]
MKKKNIKFMIALIIVSNVVSNVSPVYAESELNSNCSVDEKKEFSQEKINEEIDTKDNTQKEDRALNVEESKAKINSVDIKSEDRENKVAKNEREKNAIINIPDSALKSALLSKLGKPVGSDITQSDMESLTEFTSTGTGIISLEGLQYATNLNSLVLTNNKIVDLSPIGGLANLKTLILDQNKIDSLVPLNKLRLTKFSALNQVIEHEFLPYNGKASTNSVPKDNDSTYVVPINISNKGSYGYNGVVSWGAGLRDSQTASYEFSRGDLFYTTTTPQYSGKVTHQVNLPPPINNIPNITIKIGDKFAPMEGVSSIDYEDGDITSKMTVKGTVDTSKVGVYTLQYSITDSFGLGTILNRKITVRSNEVPVIDGAIDTTINVGDSFDPMLRVTASDREDGDLTSALKVTGTVDTSKAGTNKLTYEVTDKDGNKVTKERTITVKSNYVPVINGALDTTIKVGDSFDPMLRVTASDAEDGDLTSALKVTGTVDTSTVGTNKLTYEVTDKDGNKATKERTITVRSNEVPVIDGAIDSTIKVGDSFDPMLGVTASDAEEGDLTSALKVTGIVDTSIVGTNKLTYEVTDKDGNKATKERTITVRSNEVPVIDGAIDSTIKVGDSFDPMLGVTASDAEEGDLTSALKVTGTVDTSTVGTNKLTYEVTDKDGNKATKERTITVKNIITPNDDQSDKNDKSDNDKNNNVNEKDNYLKEYNDKINNPKTGDRGVLGLVGLGLAAVCGLFINRKRK